MKFQDALSGICAKELADAHGDADRIGAMIERLASSLAFTIAMASGGDLRRMEELLQGAEGYMTATASGHARLGSFMAKGKRQA